MRCARKRNDETETEDADNSTTPPVSVAERAGRTFWLKTASAWGIHPHRESHAKRPETNHGRARKVLHPTEGVQRCQRLVLNAAESGRNCVD
jgi:hypothetical protein